MLHATGPKEAPQPPVERLAEKSSAPLTSFSASRVRQLLQPPAGVPGAGLTPAITPGTAASSRGAECGSAGSCCCPRMQAIGTFTQTQPNQPHMHLQLPIYSRSPEAHL